MEEVAAVTIGAMTTLGEEQKASAENDDVRAIIAAVRTESAAPIACMMACGGFEEMM